MYLLALLTGCVLLFHCEWAKAQGDNIDLARESFDDGQKKYDEGDFEGALQAYQESLAAFPHFRTIFNIALCYEKLDRISLAIEMYTRYLDWPTEVPNRDEVAKKVGILKLRMPPEPPPPVDSKEEVETEQESGPVEVVLESPGPEQESTLGRRLFLSGVITSGAGVAAILTGGVLLGVARARLNEMRSAENNGKVYDSSRHGDLPEEGETFQSAGWAVMGIGLAAASVGVTLLVLSRKKTETKAAALLAVDPGGDGLQMGLGVVF